MFGSARPTKPDKPSGGKHGPPPNPDDRYTPTDIIRLDMMDVDGTPVTVVLTRRAARNLADQLFQHLCDPAPEGGAQ